MSKTSLKNEIYRLDEHYSKSLEILAKDSKINPKNREIIKGYVQDRVALEEITKTRAIMVIDNLRRLASFTKKPLTELLEKDIKQILSALNAKNYSEWTKVTSKKILKAFLRSAMEKPEALLKLITCKTPQNKKRAEDLLTEQEMSAMVGAAESQMEKALLAVLFETGVRPGELLTIRIKDVFPNEFKARIYVSGKTEKVHGERPVYAYRKSYSLLKAWLSAHPRLNDKEAPLWLNKKNQQITLSRLFNIYRKNSDKAGITKTNNPYLARHTRLTQFYRDYGSAIGSELAGHIPGSKEVRTYLHLSESDVESALDTAFGLKDKKQDSETQKCPKCQLVNPYGEIICTSCHTALNGAGALVVESEREQELQELKELNILLSNPEIINILKALKNPDVIATIKNNIGK
ncbi:site-specific integrase [Candidatus Woesearchaeota archaeon]|nr:site-specific integrase [Candidatus Woesearchaeota archaeon]